MKRSTLAALVVLAALGAYIYWFERGPVPEAQAERFFDVKEDAIVRIELRDHDDPPVVAEKTDSRWRLVAPVEADADPSEMDLLAQNLATLGYERAVAKASEVKLSDYGLDAPKVRVRFETEGGPSRGIDFGADTPTTGNQYARREGGDDVLVVASHLSLNFQKTAWDLRDKMVFHVADDAEARRVEIDRTRGELVLARENGSWRVVEPLKARADRLEASGLVTRFRQARMEDVLSETPEGASDTGLSSPRFALRIDFEGETAPLVLEIGNERELESVARTPSRPEVFLLDGGLVADLDKPPEAFVSKRLFAGASYEVTRLRIDGREIERRGSGEEESWHETAPEEAEVSAEAVRDLLFELSSTSAEDVLLHAPELAEPAHTIAWVSGDSGREETLRIFAPEGERVYARREGDAVVLELGAEAWAKVASRLALVPDDPSASEGAGEASAEQP